jgi:small-conductance mechanosensitive channel
VTAQNASSASAQEAPAPASVRPSQAAEPLSLENLTAHRDQAREQLAELERALAGGSTEVPEATAERRRMLRSIDSTLSRALEVMRPAAELEERADESIDLAEPSLSRLIELEESLHQEQARTPDLDEALEAASQAVARAKQAHERREAERRQRQVELRDVPERERAAAQASLEMAQLRARQAEATLALQQVERRSARAEQAAHAQRVELLQAAVRQLRATLAKSGAPTTAHEETALAERETQLRQRADTLASQERRAQLELERARRRFEGQADPSTALLEQVETLSVSRDALAERATLIEQQLARLEEERALQQIWRSVLRGALSRAELRQQAGAARERAAELSREVVQRGGRLAALRTRADELRLRLESGTLEPPVRDSLQRRLEALGALIEAHARDTDDLSYQQRLAARFGDAGDEAAGGASVGEQLARAWSSVRGLWRYEITAVDDEPITVGNAFSALLLISVGFWASRRLSELARSAAEKRLRIDAGVASALQTGIFYLLVVTFGLLALRSVNFPLTAFTFAGGALAIGIGFGSQNVMNNFISGLILMLERPVRPADVVEVEGTYGTIERIGARSTRIAANDGRHIIVPNSFFLENNVVNWTLSHDRIRAELNVGIAYGSPTRDAERLIRQAIDENPGILKQPAPIILFTDFGDNSLNFRALFWVRARTPVALNGFLSEVRFRVDDLFREAGITIAFPQRDVHLDSLSPVEVRILERGTSETK